MAEIRKLTNSMRSKFNACHRAYKIAYVDLIRPAKASDALSFGTAMHALLEAYWGGQETMVLTGDDYTDATLRCLFEGYKAKWEQSDAEHYERVGAEFGFEAPLMNPETGGVSKTFHLSGKIDALAKEKTTGKRRRRRKERNETEWPRTQTRNHTKTNHYEYRRQSARGIGQGRTGTGHPTE